MKTIYTSLPIYDRLEKQCFEKGKKGGFNTPVPIVCPRHRLPSFQWNAEADNMGAVTKVELIDQQGETYNGNTGIKEWTNGTFDSVSTNGLEILSAVNMAAAPDAHNANMLTTASYNYHAHAGEVIRFKGTLDITAGTPSTMPQIIFFNNSGAEGASVSLAEGVNEITHTVLANSATLNPSDGLQIGITAISKVTFTLTDVEITVDTINQLFPTLPATTVLTTDTYYSYNGDTLNYLLPVGIYYLKITTANGFILYSDWFKVDCVYENIITVWTNVDYDTFSSNNTTILSAINNAGTATMLSSAISVTKGEVITVVLFLTSNSGELPTVDIINSSGGASLSGIPIVLSAGLNILNFTIIGNATGQIINYNAAAANFSTSEVLVQRSYSEKYLTINFHNDCDLGDILYSEGFDQTIWFESETMEPSFPQEEQGMTNGDGRFVRSFARQVKQYIARTKEMPSFMVDVFNRMKLHDTVELIDLVGDVNDVYNLEVGHQWIGDDKYYTNIDLTFDYNEAFVIAGCCNNLT
jgi:hypothetical protein